MEQIEDQQAIGLRREARATLLEFRDLNIRQLDMPDIELTDGRLTDGEVRQYYRLALEVGDRFAEPINTLRFEQVRDVGNNRISNTMQQLSALQYHCRALVLLSQQADTMRRLYDAEFYARTGIQAARDVLSQHAGDEALMVHSILGRIPDDL